MILLYGLRETKVAVAPTSQTCQRCSDGPMVGVVFQSYFHVWYIPMFPIRKRSVAACTKCLAVETKSSGELQKSLIDLRKKTKLPKWTFAGSAIASVLFLASRVMAG